MRLLRSPGPVRAYAATPITGTAIISGLTAPKGVAVDAFGNLYIAETGSVLMQSINNGVQTTVGQRFCHARSPGCRFQRQRLCRRHRVGRNCKADHDQWACGAADPALRFWTAQRPSAWPWMRPATFIMAIRGTANVVQVPVSGTTAAIASGFAAPAGVALDPSGNLYVADSTSAAGISYFNRTAATLPAIPDRRTSDATLTNVGNASYSGGISANSDINAATDFTFAAGASNGCNTPTSLTLAAGSNCELAVSANTVDCSRYGYVHRRLDTGAQQRGLRGQSIPPPSLSIPVTSITYGASINGSATVTPASGSLNPTGTVTLLNGSTPLGTCTLANATGNTSSCSFSLLNVAAGIPTITASYGGDSNNGTSSVERNSRQHCPGINDYHAELDQQRQPYGRLSLYRHCVGYAHRCLGDCVDLSGRSGRRPLLPARSPAEHAHGH